VIQFDHSMAKFQSNIYSTDLSFLKTATKNIKTISFAYSGRKNQLTDFSDDDDEIRDKIHKHFCFLPGKDYVFERRMPFFFVLGVEWMKA